MRLDAGGRAARRREHPSGGQRADGLAHRPGVPRRRYVRLRLLYILAKLTQYIDLRAYGETEGTKWLSKYTSGGFEIVHIFPQQPSSEATVEFGEHEDPDIADLLGNLVLVERPAIGKTKIDSAVLDPFPEWNEAAVIERQNKLTVLARSVWRLPTSSVE